jgi:hypothetical protein
MDEFVKSVFTAPVATLFIVAGILFLLIAVVGNISGRIEPGVKGRIFSGVLGLTFVFIGLAMHLTQKVPQMPELPGTSQQQIKRDQLPEASRRAECSRHWHWKFWLDGWCLTHLVFYEGRIAQ